MLCHALTTDINNNKIMESVIWLNRNLAYSLYPSLDRDGYRIDLGAIVYRGYVMSLSFRGERVIQFQVIYMQTPVFISPNRGGLGL